MNRRRFIKTVSASIPAISILPYLTSCSLSNKRQPNIVLILADDLGYGDLSCYGQTHFATPNIDKLAKEGMMFTQHYAGSPVCAPSRCVLMTGKHTGHSYVRGNMQAVPSGQLPLPASETTFAKILQANGYATGCFGKWGLGIAGSSGDPLNHGFDVFFGYHDQVLAHNSYPEYLYKNREKVYLDNEVQYVSKDHWSKGLGSVSSMKKEYSNDLIFEQAMNFMEANVDNPFFLYFPTTIPHDNGEAPRGERFEVPENEQFADKEWSDEEKAYASLVVKLDDYVGELEKKLEELNIADNTVFIFTSDNGALNPDNFENRFKSNGKLRGYKRDVYEGGIRVPLIVKWPGVVEPGSKSGHISGFQDYLTTVCDIAGIEHPETEDGISFMPTLVNSEQAAHTSLYWEFHWWKPSIRAMRLGKWKAVQMGPGENIELYDLDRDIEERFDVSTENPEILSKMRVMLDKARTPSEHWSW